ncbi:MAG: Holliday junction resolvase RuvX [Holosporales bacterium]|jgi:putative Holliday junction resolvase|nr:Holliday junction resolvase RuvX [Holosporales bacterium]
MGIKKARLFAMLSDVGELPHRMDFSCYIGKSRVLCLDYGDRRIGVAISDIGWRIGSPVTVLDNHGAFRRLFHLIEIYEISIVILGFPVSLKGEKRGMQADKIKAFGQKLEKLIEQQEADVRVLLWDERFSTQAAHRILSEIGASDSRKKKEIDKVAASFVLQGFLDWVKNNTSNDNSPENETTFG